MADIYTQEFLYHYREQPYEKKLERHTHVGSDTNTACGDEIKITLFVQNGIIKDVGYSQDACIVSQASVSILVQEIVGKKLSDVKKLSVDEFMNMLNIELTSGRQKCALVGFNALKEAIKDES